MILVIERIKKVLGPIHKECASQNAICKSSFDFHDFTGLIHINLQEIGPAA